MKIAILGTRGVPNFHGGFEQFAEFFSIHLIKANHDVYLYSSSSHPYQDKTFRGVKIIHCYDPEDKIGTFGQFIYDLNCILDSRKRNFDIILQLGYTSSSIWTSLMPKDSIIITNMDGLEWKRKKYSLPVRNYLKYAEKIAAIKSHFLVADSLGIKEYLKEKYNKESEFIAYGATLFDNPQENLLGQYDVVKYKYNMLIARIEPENNIETILDGIVLSGDKTTFLVVGKYHINKFGVYLKKKFNAYQNIRFLGGVYNLEHLNNLRYYSNLYFHGHSVGGTNPSLLEAMASSALIIANDNVFNKSILQKDALFFKNKNDISNCVRIKKSDRIDLIENNKNKILKNYSWEIINDKYLAFFNECYRKNKIANK
ncbi:MAG: glycosyltransferase family 1 protein [Bacteroidetes bacterium]|nr:MAG: glycosyltransferase family 1 protein [Bacteroidota bacterium]